MEMGHSHHVTSSTVTLLKASQVEDIFNGRDQEFKVGTEMRKKATKSPNVEEERLAGTKLSRPR